MAYTPEQQQWAQSYIGAMGSDAGKQGAQKLWDSFGGDQTQFNQAINAYSAGSSGNLYDPAANANAYRQNSQQGQAMQQAAIPSLDQTGAGMGVGGSPAPSGSPWLNESTGQLQQNNPSIGTAPTQNNRLPGTNSAGTFAVSAPQASAANNFGGTGTPNYQIGTGSKGYTGTPFNQQYGGGQLGWQPGQSTGGMNAYMNERSAPGAPNPYGDSIVRYQGNGGPSYGANNGNLPPGLSGPNSFTGGVGNGNVYPGGSSTFNEGAPGRGYNGPPSFQQEQNSLNGWSGEGGRVHDSKQNTPGFRYAQATLPQIGQSMQTPFNRGQGSGLKPLATNYAGQVTPFNAARARTIQPFTGGAAVKKPAQAAQPAAVNAPKTTQQATTPTQTTAKAAPPPEGGGSWAEAVRANLSSGGVDKGDKYKSYLDSGYMTKSGGEAFSNEGGISGSTSPTEYRLNFDNPNVPKPTPAGLTTQQVAQIQKEYGGFGPVGNGGLDPKDLYDPKQVWNDPNYGPMTTMYNWKKDSQKPELLDILGPMAVGGLAGLASGGLGLVGSAIIKAPQMATQLFGPNGGSFNPSSLIPGLAGAAAKQFIPFLSSLGGP